MANIALMCKHEYYIYTNERPLPWDTSLVLSTQCAVRLDGVPFYLPSPSSLLVWVCKHGSTGTSQVCHASAHPLVFTSISTCQGLTQCSLQQRLFRCFLCYAIARDCRMLQTSLHKNAIHAWLNSGLGNYKCAGNHAIELTKLMRG